MSTGKAWEAQLEAACRAYHTADKSLVWRCHPPVRVHRKARVEVIRGRQVVVFPASWDGTGPCDFAGVVRPGRAVAFDAKDCEGTRWPFAGLELHQARHLEGVARMGGLAFVAVRVGGAGWVLPWAELGPRWWAWERSRERARPGTASWGPDDGWGLRMPGRAGWLDACVEAGLC